MTNLIMNNLLLILFMPLWIFLIVMVGRFFSVYVHKKIVYALTLISSFLGIIVSLFSYLNAESVIEWEIPFIKINDFILTFGIRIDKLSLILSALLFTVSFCVQLFSISYMGNEKKNYRFFALMNLFNFSMSFLLFSPNLYQMYFFWELVSIISYLLIGFNYLSKDNSVAAKRVLITNRIGDMFFLGAILFSSSFLYFYADNKALSVLDINDFNAISTLLMAYSSKFVYCLICLFFVIGAAVKSAQIPFYTWLQDAMKAPTPVSALLHSATMVAAGVYLLIRLMPFFTLYNGILNIIYWVGILTILVCSVQASLENHPKKILAYSTSANYGLLFVSAAMENITGCVLFLVIHGILKAAMFMTIPRDNQNISKCNWVLLTICSISMVFFAKSNLRIENVYIENFLVFISSYYLFRLLFIFNVKNLSNNIVEMVSVILLILVNILLYIKIPPHLSYFIVFAIVGAILCQAFPKLNKPQHIIENINYSYIPNLYTKIAQKLDVIEQKIFMNYKPVIKTSSSLVYVNAFIESKIMNGVVRLVTKIVKSLSKFYMKLQNKNVQSYNAYAFILVTIILALVIIGHTYLLSAGG